MYHYIQNEQELGFDAFVAPDDFNPKDETQYGGDHPVDIYNIFKREYAINNHARYIYYYSPGNYPLTLTPTAIEYYRYGYTTGGTEVVVDVPLNGDAVTIFGETNTAKRWVIVCRPSTERLALDFRVSKAKWLYIGNFIYSIFAVSEINYIHCANINSITSIPFQSTFGCYSLSSTCIIPETVSSCSPQAFTGSIGIFKVVLPNTKNVNPGHAGNGNLNSFWWPNVLEYYIGASELSKDVWAYYYNPANLRILQCSEQNRIYWTANYCDILYNKTKTIISHIAPKTVRGLTIPDQLPQSQIGVDSTTGIGTKLSTNIMQGYPLYIGTLITDLTNLYLSNKSFTTITVGAGNTAFTVENNILFNADKTTLIKAGSASAGNVTIPTTVTSVSPNAFLRYTHTGSIPLIFSGTGQFDLSNYNNFQFATFTGQSINDIIINDKLAHGTIGNPKYFYISQASLDALNAYNSNAVNIAAGRYINISTFPQGAVLHLDASNMASYPGSGTTWYDLSGNGNNGTLVNGVAYSNGVMNTDGVNDFVDCGSINSTTGSLSISLWFKSSNINTARGILSKWKTSAETDNSYLIQNDDTTKNLFKFIVYQSNNLQKTVMASDFTQIANTWYNIVCVAGNGVISMYINGVKSIYTQTYDNTIKQTTRKTLIGKLRQEDSIYSTLGSVNDVLIYDKPISDSEVSIIFNTQKSKYGL